MHGKLIAHLDDICNNHWLCVSITQHRVGYSNFLLAFDHNSADSEPLAQYAQVDHHHLIDKVQFTIRPLDALGH